LLDHALGALERHVGDLRVPRRRLVEGRGEAPRRGSLLDLVDLLGTLVDEHHERDDVRFGLGEAVHEIDDQARATRMERTMDRDAVAEPERCEQIDHPERGRRLERQPSFGVLRLEVVEQDLVALFVRCAPFTRSIFRARSTSRPLSARGSVRRRESPVRRLKRRIWDGET
jgi:hypothetical protein